MGLKMAELKPLTKAFQEKMRAAQMSRNTLLAKQASYEYKMSLKKRGVNTFLPMINMIQIPFLLTWFFSLRYPSYNQDT